ncbi:MAG: hypothetical protein WBF53_09865 [Litorimonas sp.]
MSDTDVTFRPLGKYDWPTTPAVQGFDRIRADLRKRLAGWVNTREDTPGIDVARVDPIAPDILDRIAEAPANQPVLAELTATLRPWLDEPKAAQVLQTVVLPPCDRENLLLRWSEQEGLDVFPTDKLASDLAELDDPSAMPLVIPRLEDRFLRTPEGLIAVRALIDQLAAMRRRTVVGCNSWAWQFLRKSCEIDLVLTDPMTFRAFNANRLRNWLGTLAFGSTDGIEAPRTRFLSETSGRDVFGNGDGEAELSSFMNDLAKRSLGIPWVAWNLWRASLEMEKAKEGDDTDEPGDPVPDIDKMDTIWVSELHNFALPGRSDQNALLVLHALLIHGGLTEPLIGRTVPLVSYTNVLASLLGAGLVDRAEDGAYRCVPAAYPAIRDGLKNNGYPVDVL